MFHPTKVPRSVYSAVCATCLIDKIWNNTPQGGGYIIDISSTLFLFRIKCVFHGECTVIVVGAGQPFMVVLLCVENKHLC